MNAFEILGVPVRRRIVELLVQGESPAGAVAEVITAEFGITQPAVSNQLRILRDAGFASARAQGSRRLYVVRSDVFDEVDVWLATNRQRWEHALGALDTEIARGRSRRRQGRPL